jgi:hypothetical protein
MLKPSRTLPSLFFAVRKPGERMPRMHASDKPVSSGLATTALNPDSRVPPSAETALAKYVPLDEGDRKCEFLLKLNSDRVNELEGALERNWMAHLILAGIGLALVIPIGKFRDIVANYFVREPYDQTVIATVFLAILLYYFMKLGHLMTLYMEAIELRRGLLKKYLGPHPEAGNLVSRKSTNFYVEAFFGMKPYSDDDTSLIYLLVTSIIASIAQSSALYLVGQAFGLWRWLPLLVLASGACGITYTKFAQPPKRSRTARTIAALPASVFMIATLVLCFRSGLTSLILLVAGALIMLLYFLFWSANKRYPQTWRAVAASLLFTMLCLTLFAATQR